jgi:pimeloyl-ACP methyl ester carboxylesterase
MKYQSLVGVGLVVLGGLGVGCGGSNGTGGVSGGGASTGSSSGDGGGGTTTMTSSGAGGGASSSSSGSTTSSSSSGGASVPDPNQNGPYAYMETDTTINVAASGDNNVPIHCAYPTSGPSAGPYPVVVVAHGLSLPANQYYGYVKRLASFGYVALTVDFPSSPFSVNNPAEAQDLLAGIDWAKNDPTVGPKADPSHAGMTGHSLGGKVALLAATMDARVKAAIVLDPVDGGAGSCTAPSCVMVAPLMASLHIPTGFLGETTDGSGGFMPCAPTADNFTTFYAQTNSPSLEVTVLGADHMSFLDDEAGCMTFGLSCSSVCSAGTAPNAQVNGMAHAYVAAFYERWLRGNTGYDTYLTGAEAQARYVTTSEATLVSK